MKKIILSAFVVLTFIFYALHERNEVSENPVIPPKSTSNDSQGTKTNQTSGGMPNGSAQTMMQISPSPYKDGSYTGNVADAFYGNIQVRAIIQNGKITDVQFLQYPNDRDRSIEINTQAMPYLRQEAIQAQDSKVDIVSGATDTSAAFIESMRSALSQAK